MTKIWVKTCTACGGVKTLDQFYQRPGSAEGEGYASRCHGCRQEYQAAYRAERKAQGKTYYVPVDPEKNRQGRQPNHPKWVAGLGEEDIPVYGSDRYNLGRALFRRNRTCLAWYEAHSRHGCELCGTRNLELMIDHDHSCCPGGKRRCGLCNRGMLCGPCNTNLGFFEAGKSQVDPSSEWGQRAQMYLQPGHQTLFDFLPR